MSGYKPRKQKTVPLDIKYTHGNEYMDSDGVAYNGYYYVSNGISYLYNPEVSLERNTILLYKLVKDRNIIEYFVNVNKNRNIFVSPEQKYPSVTDLDYENKYIKRFFIQNKSTTDVIEINEEQFSNIDIRCLNGKKINGNLYEGFTIDWKITGPKNDKFRNSVLVESGVSDTNSRTIRLLDPKYPKLKKVLRDYVELWKGY